MKSYASSKKLLSISLLLCVLLSIQDLTAAPSKHAVREQKDVKPSSKHLFVKQDGQLLTQTKLTKRGVGNDINQPLKTLSWRNVPTPETNKYYPKLTYIPQHNAVNIDIGIVDYFKGAIHKYLDEGMNRIKAEITVRANKMYWDTLSDMMGMVFSPSDLENQQSMISSVFDLQTNGHWFTFHKTALAWYQKNVRILIDDFVVALVEPVLKSLFKQLGDEATNGLGGNRKWSMINVRDVVDKVMDQLDAEVRRLHWNYVRMIIIKLPSEFRDPLKSFMPDLKLTDLRINEGTSVQKRDPISHFSIFDLLSSQQDIFMSQSRYVLTNRIMENEWAVKDMIKDSLLQMFDQMPQPTGNDANSQTYQHQRPHNINSHGQYTPQFIFGDLPQSQILRESKENTGGAPKGTPNPPSYTNEEYWQSIDYNYFADIPPQASTSAPPINNQGQSIAEDKPPVKTSYERDFMQGGEKPRQAMGEYGLFNSGPQPNYQQSTISSTQQQSSWYPHQAPVSNPDDVQEYFWANSVTNNGQIPPPPSEYAHFASPTNKNGPMDLNELNVSYLNEKIAQHYKQGKKHRFKDQSRRRRLQKDHDQFVSQMSRLWPEEGKSQPLSSFSNTQSDTSDGSCPPNAQKIHRFRNHPDIITDDVVTHTSASGSLAKTGTQAPPTVKVNH